MEVDINIGPFEIPSQGDVNSSLAKPPFNATPLGQNLSYPNRVTDNADATSTSGGNNPTGGYPGLTRDGGKKFHGGFDDPSQEPFRNDLARYTGTKEGTVVYAGPAFTNKGQYLGYQVKIKMEDGIDIYESSTIHHKEALVLTGAKVQPNDPIGIGSGEGNQFNSSESGGPHLHWRLKKNGKLINPLDGSELKK